MTFRRLAMIIQEEIIRLKNLGHSQRKVAQILGIDRGTVIRYWNGSPPEIIKTLPPWALKIDWDYLNKELKTVPKKILYEELKESIDLPSYQAFCSYLKKHATKKDPDITIKIDRNPGASIEVDYSGDSFQIINPSTGQIYNVELFVGALSYSGKIYAEFTLTQQLEDFIRAHNNMFQFFGGVSSYIIPDNCKTAVIKADSTDPIINSTYLDMCKHYQIAVDPADKESPRQKPNVEKGVGYLQSDFLPRIRKRSFTSLIELNKELRSWLLKINQIPIQGRGKSREFFYNKEKEFLKKLPSSPYDLYYFKKAKVHPDCHFQHNKNYYSVPYQYVGKEIDIKFNNHSIHAYYQCTRIATHKSIKGTYHWSTNHGHYPEKKYLEFNFHLKLIEKQSIKVGENVHGVIIRLLKESKYPLKIIRKAQGILRLEKTFGREILNYACGEALEFDTLNFDNIRRFAKYYNKRPKEISKAPVRQLDLICLQGGLND